MEQDELNRREHERHLYREHIGSCAVFAKELLRGSFVINGAAVTAIMASQKFELLKVSVFIFAAGALAALVSGYFAYIYQYNIAFTFKWYVTKNKKDIPQTEYDEKERNRALGVGIISLVLFVLGLMVSACSLG